MVSGNNPRRDETLPASEAVIWRVAECAGEDPTEMPPLRDVIDTDALNELFRRSRQSANGNVQAMFSYHGHTVIVHGAGSVTVYRDDGPCPAPN